MSESDFDLNDASSAARRLSPETIPSQLESLKASLRLLDQQLPEDRPLDPVTQLRSGLDYTEMLASAAGDGRQASDRVSEFLGSLISTKPGDGNGLLRQMEGAAATGVVGSLGALKAAIDQDQVEFMFNNPSEIWQNLEASQTLFAAVRQAKRLLNELAQTTKVGNTNLKDANELIEALQNEIVNQLAGAKLETKLKRPPTKKDKIKKIGGHIIGPPSKSSRTRW